MTSQPNRLFLKVFLPIVLILLVVTGGLQLLKGRIGKGTGGHPTETLHEGMTIPELALTLLDGRKAQLSDFKAKVYLINFWATWCEACIVEMPSIVKLRKDFHAKGFEVLAVNVDDNPESVVPAAAKKLGMDFPILVDPGNRLSDIFDVRAIPMSAIITEGRQILFLESGERDWNSKEVRDQLLKWLEPR
jgi:thiol-disulfide isomerase/thioredoxin